MIRTDVGSKGEFATAAVALPRRTMVAGLAFALAVTVATGQAATKSPGPRPNPRTGLVEEPITGLVAAVKRGDRAETQRLANRIGLACIGLAVRDGDSPTATAAVEAVPLVPGAERLAGLVAARLDATDEQPLAGAAARTLGILLDGGAPDRFAEWDVPPDQIEVACDALRRSATRPEAPTALRLAVLDALAQASRACATTADLAPLLRDPDPSVRRAAVLALRPPQGDPAAALEGLIRDPSPPVASAATAALCRKRPPSPQAVQAARILVLHKDVPVEDAIEMLACLEASRQAQDIEILSKLRTGSPGPLSDRANELAGPGPKR